MQPPQPPSPQPNSILRSLPTPPRSSPTQSPRTPRPSFPPPRTDLPPSRPISPPPLPSPAAVLAANRLAPARPVSVWSGFTESTEPTTTLAGNEPAAADLTAASSVHSLGGFARSNPAVARRDSARRAALNAQQAGAGRPREGGQRHAQGQGHRPSLSLSSIRLGPVGASVGATGGACTVGPRMTPSPRPTLKTGGASYFDPALEETTSSDPKLHRRASLSDLPDGGALKIPARILAAQGRIEGDLERVKQFAQGVKDLKALQARHAQLLSALTDSPALQDGHRESVVSNTSTTAVVASSSAPRRDSHALATLDIDYRSWWEQAEALINLGDGTKEDHQMHTQPSQRDRAVKFPPGEGSSSGQPQPQPQPQQRLWNRSSSVISFETNESVQDRQREMLQGVILGAKGSTLPTRSPPSPRPPLSIIAPVRTLQKPPPLGPVRAPADRARTRAKRTSRTGLSGIRDFLFRLKARAAEAELGEEVDPSRRSFTDPIWTRRGSPSPSPTPTPSPAPSSPGVDEEEEEDWDRELGLDRSPSLARSMSLAKLSAAGGGLDEAEPSSARRKRTQSTRVARVGSGLGGINGGLGMGDSGIGIGGGGSGGVGGEGYGACGRMVLTTEAMPGLVKKVGEVRTRLEECVRRLEGMGARVER